MNTRADKNQDNKSQQAAVNRLHRKQPEKTSMFEMADERPEALEMLQLQQMASDSSKTTQLKALQQLMHNSPRTQRLMTVKSLAGSSPRAQQTMQLQTMVSQHTLQKHTQLIKAGEEEEEPIQEQFEPVQRVTAAANEEEDENTKSQTTNPNKQVTDPNNTGLPDKLKTGIENLSGYSMDDVKVHYNSDKPAQLNAHAYARGTDIHLGAGQEKHLPHEAWHVVQQKQGRVKPTIQLKDKTNINDDTALEKEADVMGAKALDSEGYYTKSLTEHSGNTGLNTIQMAGFTANTSPNLDTTVSAIKKKTGVSATNMGLPFTSSIAGKTERAEKITAEIDKSSVSSAKRKDDKSKLSKITGMARDEAFILIGADPQKFYDAGHLVGDQLLKGLGDQVSFELKNLAPQASNFNSPAYANIMEDPIKKEAENGKKIEVNVDLKYPKDYKAKVSTLIDRGIIDVNARNDKKGTVDIEEGNKGVKFDDEITFYRRIPKEWKMTAKETSGQTLSGFNIKSDQKSVQKLLPSSTGLDEKNLSLKKPFKFAIEGIDKSGSTIGAIDKSKDTIAFKEVRDRILDARQWKPPKIGKITKEELVGALDFFFPSVEDAQLNEFFGIVKNDDFETIEKINSGMLQIIVNITGVNILSSDEFNNFKTRILAALNNAKKSLNEGNENDFKIHLRNASIALSEFRERSEELVEEAQQLRLKINNDLELMQQRSKELNQIISNQGKKFEISSIFEITKIQFEIFQALSEAAKTINTPALDTALKMNAQANSLLEQIDEIIHEELKKAETGSVSRPQITDTGLFSGGKSLSLQQDVPSMTNVNMFKREAEDPDANKGTKKRKEE